jgi:probable phosphoglycerate mutase
MSTVVWLIRHGETAWNAEERIQGHLQVPLNTRGREQAAAVAACLAGEPITAIYASDLIRASCTAAPIADALGLTVRLDARLREWDLGVLTGLSKEQAQHQQPDAYAIYRRRLVDRPVPGGESIRSRVDRVTDALTEITRAHDGEQVVVVSHGGPLGDCYRRAVGALIDERMEVDLHNAAINRLRMDADDWHIERWGERTHLAQIGTLANLEGRR